MQPLYVARIEDLARGDCREGRLRRLPSRRALRTPDFLLRLGLSPSAKVLDLKARVPRMRTARTSRCVGQVGRPSG
jgi:hypothetical protein